MNIMNHFAVHHLHCAMYYICDVVKNDSVYLQSKEGWAGSSQWQTAAFQRKAVPESDDKKSQGVSSQWRVYVCAHACMHSCLWRHPFRKDLKDLKEKMSSEFASTSFSLFEYTYIQYTLYKYGNVWPNTKVCVYVCVSSHYTKPRIHIDTISTELV